MAKGGIKGTFIGVLVASALLGTGVYFFYFSETTPETAASYFMYPILVAQNAVVEPYKESLQRKQTVGELESVVSALRKERDDLVATVVQLEASLHYAKEIQEVIDFKQRYDYGDAIFVGVMTQHISDQGHYFMIDAGSEKGVKKDMVAVYKNGLVGRVVEVYPLYSKLQLITDKQCKVPACCTTTNATGIHVGDNQIGRTQLERVSHLAQLQVDDLVISAGQGLVFPQGFALGRIVSFTTQEILYDVVIEPLFDVRTIKYCYLIQKGNQI